MTAPSEETHTQPIEVTCPGCFYPRKWDAAGVCPICHYRASLEGRSATLLPVGTQLKGYVVGEKLGQGGFGITYRGFDLTLHMKVAVKEYYPSELVGRSTDHKTVVLNSRDHEEPFNYCLRTFLKEAQTIAKIRHLHIVRVLSYFELNGTAYLVMDYYEGEDLARHLKLHLRDQPSLKLPWRQAVTLLLPVLEGLQKVHQAGFMHRDIKPGNLYLTDEGLILLDFGSARQVTSNHTRSLLIFSEGYAPYEQYIEGQLNRQGPWTDVYAAAATLYVMLTAHRLPSGLDRIQAHLRQQPDLLKPARHFVPELPVALDEVLRRALAVEPEQRMQSVAEFKRELEAVLAAEEKRLSDVPPKPRSAPERMSKLNLRVAVIAMALTGLAWGGWWIGFRVPPDSLKPPTSSVTAPASVPASAAPPAPVVVTPPAPVVAGSVAGSMVKIPGGCFQMGSPESEDGHQFDERQHQVCVKGFEIGQYEVTQRQWQAVMGSNPSQFQGCLDCPVEQVSWNDIPTYLEALNAQTGKTYRLPTEAEWEYACRGGVAGERYCGGDDINRLAWYENNSGDETHPVGQKASNGFGLYDMSGNVWEWTCSAYHKNYGGAETERTGKDTTGALAVRGGSWYNIPAWVRSAARTRNAPAHRGLTLGFRLARSL